MEIFAQILRRLSIDDASSSRGCVTPFKVHINFDIPIFEGHIDTNIVDKWLNLLEGYFLSITFALLEVVPYVKYWWDTFCEKEEMKETLLFTVTLI